MKKAIIYIHGKGGNAGEAEHYKPIFPGFQVIGFDYKAKTPWEAKKEFSEYFSGIGKKYDAVSVIACSIGAFYLMNAEKVKIEKVCFISPVADMEKLITDMMEYERVTEDELSRKKEIETQFGETLSWEYLSYVRNNKIKWDVPTFVLYGSEDNLISYETILEFTQKVNAKLTVMKSGEHWFHTGKQMEFLDSWVKSAIG